LVELEDGYPQVIPTNNVYERRLCTTARENIHVP